MCRIKQIEIPWSDLPKELLEKIAKCLDNETDVLRFRAVCCSWRSSATPFRKFSCETVKLPFPFDPSAALNSSKFRGGYFSLVERTVYRVELPDGEEENLNFWLVKTEQSSDGKRRILLPLSHCPVEIPPQIQMPTVLNTLDFRVSEVRKSYSLKRVNPSKINKNYGCGYAKKVILCAGEKNDEYVVMAIDNHHKFWYIKSGDEKWTGPVRFHDIVCCKGQFYGIDLCGSTWVFDLNFEFSKVSHNSHNIAFKKYFVELYNGELFLVEVLAKRCLGLSNGPPLELRSVASMKAEVDIIIYAWDKHEKEWVKKNLVNDWIIVVCDDCSYAVPVSAKGCKETHVFYQRWRHFFYGEDMDPDFAQYLVVNGHISECFCSDGCGSFGDDNFIASEEVKLKFRGFHGDKFGVCDYQSGKTGSMLMFPEYAGIFWPPPSWLYRT